MKRFELLGATALALFATTPAISQTAPQADDTATSSGIDEIIVTAQRQSETLQSVPIAVSAFSAKALEAQQIENASDLQLTLPNVTFSKGNFTGSSFTIRGIGDLCVGTTCDSATAIHLNGTPLIATRLFETEYFDLERIEVLRGPQGTLFGRNATSGVVNFITAKPDLTGFKAAIDGEYGNFNAYKVKGFINAALNDTIGIRVAGLYQKRDGYTQNVFNNQDVDGRDEYAIRGSLRWQPSDTTTVDLLGYYFREKDNRSRIQKQVCQADRDTSATPRSSAGVLGCLNNRLDFGATNSNSTFVGVLSSREFLSVVGIPAAFGLGSLYGPDTNANFTNPANVRRVNTDFDPEYLTTEEQYQARLEQDFGQIKLQLTGLYHKTNVDSRQDYNLNVADRSIYAAGLGALQAAATTGFGPLPTSYFAPIAAAIIPNGPNGPLCVSDTDLTGVGSFGGNKICAGSPLDLDRSRGSSRDYSVESILTSNFDGKFNFLLGGIYLDQKAKDGDYYVNAFGIDYISGLLGTFGALGRGLAPGYLGTPYFRNNSDAYSLKSYGLFGEAYYAFNEKLKLTLGVRYNNDKKSISARSTLASFYVPFTATNAFATPRGAGFDADPATRCPTTSATGAQDTFVLGAIGSVPGCEAFQKRKVKFGEITGRAVLDYKFDDDHLLYASYSRGYKSGGINPPLQPIFAVTDSFKPEFVDSFEVGSKNSFLNDTLRLNLTAFYYKYKSLQLSRIVARTSVNDNVDANVYGFEAEAIVKPSRAVLVNMNFSYLHTKVSQDKFLSNPRDPGGGRSDSVIIKDITNGSNCAVRPNVAGNATGTNTLVTLINGSLGLRGPSAFPSDGGIASTGAFSICNAIAGAIAVPSAGLSGLLNGGAAGALPFTVDFAGIAVNIKGNQLPQAPKFKFSTGAQYTAEFGNGMTLVPRADLTYTGESSGNIFNGRVNKVDGYAQVNATVQLNGRDDRWYVRGFLQNAFDNNATTGLYVTDQSSGLFTNIFTLEPRRYGIAAGFKF